MQLIPVKERNNKTIAIAKAVQTVINEIDIESTSKPFIEANTVEATLGQIKQEHIIPVWVKDNEPVISHAELIETTIETVQEVFNGETILKPAIRLSHPIKGRIPEAKHKAAKDLLEHEKTLYYERMAFVVEIPTISTDIGNNRLNLTIGGIKAYNLDNLYNKSGNEQHFKVFIGFKNTVCTNLCITTDGYISNLKVRHLDELKRALVALFQEFNAVTLADVFTEFNQFRLTEQQFAQLIGRCRMYKYLPDNLKKDIPELLFGESQLNTICNDYYRDHYFCRDREGSINLWQLYNLFTGANKSSYIDTFLDRSLNAYHLTRELQVAIRQKATCWYLN